MTGGQGNETQSASCNQIRINRHCFRSNSRRVEGGATRPESDLKAVCVLPIAITDWRRRAVYGRRWRSKAFTRYEEKGEDHEKSNRYFRRHSFLRSQCDCSPARVDEAIVEKRDVKSVAVAPIEKPRDGKNVALTLEVPNSSPFQMIPGTH